MRMLAAAALIALILYDAALHVLSAVVADPDRRVAIARLYPRFHGSAYDRFWSAYWLVAFALALVATVTE